MGVPGAACDGPGVVKPFEEVRRVQSTTVVGRWQLGDLPQSLQDVWG